jgi:hypothetical protein
MEKEDHKRSAEGQKTKEERLDRHSASGTDPNPKKGGHGGWGVPGADYPEVTLDPNDPNYDAEEAKKATH